MMKKLFIAIASLVLTLNLPAWVSGEPYLHLQQSNFKYLSTYTEPYHEVMKKISAALSPKQEMSVTVSAWQDSAGNMHFSDRGQQTDGNRSQDYEVISHYTGRFAFPGYWIGTAMFAVWLVIFISMLMCWNWLTRSSSQVKQARTAGADRGESSNNSNPDLHIEYENTRSASGHNTVNSNAVGAAHRILGTTASSSPEEIKAAYHSKMRQYHPDKVAHLGQELQDVARKKATDINRAYAMLVK